MTDTDQATGTVTITLSQDDALWWRNVIDEPHTWSNPGEAQRVLSAVVAALTAAPPPAPSDDARKYCACGPGFSGDTDSLEEARGWVEASKSGAVYVRMDKP